MKNHQHGVASLFGNFRPVMIGTTELENVESTKTIAAGQKIETENLVQKAGNKIKIISCDLFVQIISRDLGVYL